MKADAIFSIRYSYLSKGVIKLREAIEVEMLKKKCVTYYIIDPSEALYLSPLPENTSNREYFKSRRGSDQFFLGVSSNGK